MSGAPAPFLSEPANILPLVIVSLPISFVLSFAIGANDVANSFGTSYGSGVLSLRACCILATIFETLGALTLGYNVSETIRKGIFEIGCYDHEEGQLALGYLSALIGSALWNLFATLLSLPVSGTHSILGALLGFTMVAKAMIGIKWYSIGIVAASWFVSPAAAGFISIIGYFLIFKFILMRKQSSRRTLILQLLPVFFAVTVFVNVFAILFKGPSFIQPFEDDLGNGLFALGFSFLLSTVVWLIVYFYWVPKQRKAVDDVLTGRKTVRPAPSATRMNGSQSKDQVSLELSNTSTADTGIESSTASVNSVPRAEGATTDNNITVQKSITEEDPPEVAQVFRSLQILTSCFGAFAHGANDVSNAIGPLIAVWLIYRQGNVYQLGDVPAYLLLLGGAGISTGLWVLGARVIKTIGENLTNVTPSSGFTIELCSSLTVLVASKLGFPISTTHCKVGSVVAVGWIRERLVKSNPVVSSSETIPNGQTTIAPIVAQTPSPEKKKGAVNWKLFLEIGAAWLLTVPISAAFSALTFWLLRLMFPVYTGSSDCVAGETPYYS